MRRTRIFLVFMLIPILTLNFAGLSSAYAENQIKVINAHNGANPTIDGLVESEEWVGVNTTTITLYGKANITARLDIQAKASYNDVEKEVYLAFIIPQPEIGGLNYICLFFHKNKSVPLLRDEGGDISINRNNDVKEIYLTSNSTHDGYTMQNGLTIYDDSEKNMKAFSKSTGTALHVEFAFPFFSSDSSGYDLTLYNGLAIDFFILYTNDYYAYPNSQFYQYNKQTDEYDLCQLYLVGSLPNKPMFILLGVTVGLLLISFLTFIPINMKRK